jgi:hypothetical protein
MPHPDIQKPKDSFVKDLKSRSQDSHSVSLKVLHDLVFYTTAIDNLLFEALDKPNLVPDIEYSPIGDTASLKLVVDNKWVFMISLFEANLLDHIGARVSLWELPSMCSLATVTQIFDINEIKTGYCLFAEMTSAVTGKVISELHKQEINWYCRSSPSYTLEDQVFKSNLEFYNWLIEAQEQLPGDEEEGFSYKYNTPLDYVNNILDLEYDLDDPTGMINWKLNLTTYEEYKNNGCI